jgi:hypothetical protein
MHKYRITLRRQLFQRIRIGNTPGFADTQRFLFPGDQAACSVQSSAAPSTGSHLLRDTAQANHSYA